MKVLLALLPLFLLLPQVQAGIVLEILNFPGNFTPSRPLSGTARLAFDEFISPEAALHAAISGTPAPTLGMQGFLGPATSYSYQPQPFTYNITANGQNTWVTYPPQTFTYNLTVGGQCGNPSCSPNCQCLNLCGPPYPCNWRSTISGLQGSVNAQQGQKFIFNSSTTILEPPHANRGTTFWAVGNVSNPNVLMSSRRACGDSLYAGFPVNHNGWVERTLSGFTLLGGNPAQAEIYIEPFGNGSLSTFRLLYSNSIPGGLYRIYQGSTTYLNFGTDAIWDGRQGYIKIFNYIGDATYIIVYLPTNGPLVCAWTSFRQPGSAGWQKNSSFPAMVDYVTPYSRAFSPQELSTLIPPSPCPAGSFNCQQSIQSYTAAEVSDPQNSVTFSWDPPSRTATAFTVSQALAQNYTTFVPFQNFSNLRAPSQPGNYTLGLSLIHQGAVRASASQGFSTCRDADADGFCEGVDCDDSRASVRPGGAESCNGQDDDCDGQTDEDFRQAFSNLGNPCGVGICAGILVCTPNGQSTVCNSQFSPGELPEYCSDEKDNDCDGVTDEQLELVGGQQRVACTCQDGRTRSCGLSVGACQEGVQTCRNGAWGACQNLVASQAELCNRIDDNCDGTVDNVGGASSAEGAQCQCYGGAAPGEEQCNDRDDNCNGQIDEGAACCSAGETRPCGLSVGACEPGTQSCEGDSWGPCQGAVTPVPEACFNAEDENCDGRVGENCAEIEAACTNGLLDEGEEDADCGGRCPQGCGLSIYYIAAGLIILFVLIAALLQYRSLHRQGPLPYTPPTGRQ